MLPVVLNVPIDGSYISALLKVLFPTNPPAIRTLPLSSSVAVCMCLSVAILPVALKSPIGAAGVPSTAVLEVMLPLLALMLLEPMLCIVAKPALSIVATGVLLDAQVSEPKVATEPSDNVPLAANCCVYPTITLADDGEIERVANTGAVTVNVALLEVKPFAEAVIVVLPCANVDVMPLAFSVATLVLLDTQEADPETLPVLPSE